MLAIDLPTLQQDVTDKESIVSCITGDPIVGDPIVDEYILSGRYDPNEYNLEIDRVFFHLRACSNEHLTNIRYRLEAYLRLRGALQDDVTIRAKNLFGWVNFLIPRAIQKVTNISLKASPLPIKPKDLNDLKIIRVVYSNDIGFTTLIGANNVTARLRLLGFTGEIQFVYRVIPDGFGVCPLDKVRSIFGQEAGYDHAVTQCFLPEKNIVIYRVCPKLQASEIPPSALTILTFPNAAGSVFSEEDCISGPAIFMSCMSPRFPFVDYTGVRYNRDAIPRFSFEKTYPPCVLPGEDVDWSQVKDGAFLKTLYQSSKHEYMMIIGLRSNVDIFRETCSLILEKLLIALNERTRTTNKPIFVLMLNQQEKAFVADFMKTRATSGCSWHFHIPESFDLLKSGVHFVSLGTLPLPVLLALQRKSRLPQCFEGDYSVLYALHLGIPFLRMLTLIPPGVTSWHDDFPTESLSGEMKILHDKHQQLCRLLTSKGLKSWFFEKQALLNWFFSEEGGEVFRAYFAARKAYVATIPINVDEGLEAFFGYAKQLQGTAGVSANVAVSGAGEDLPSTTPIASHFFSDVGESPFFTLPPGYS